MKTIVVSLGGSLLFRDGKRDASYVKQISLLLRSASIHSRLVVIVGGGSLAREYAEKARKKYGSEFYADREAIKATRENAKTLLSALGVSAYKSVCRSFDELQRAYESKKIVVAGGMFEGLTTDAIAVLAAEMLGASCVINLSNVDAIYSGDPRKNSKAKRFVSLTHAALVALASKGDQRKAGTNFVFDSVASKLSARSSIQLHFVGGRNLSEVNAALSGLRHSGTIVRG